MLINKRRIGQRQGAEITQRFDVLRQMYLKKVLGSVGYPLTYAKNGTVAKLVFLPKMRCRSYSILIGAVLYK
ncbi:hypothetical protein KDV78_22650, partial [Providencia stuartii]|uniref:hypothetical protein n=1 Tax=Providencia stuartii TaxID=588 RepID=UPI00331E4A02